MHGYRFEDEPLSKSIEFMEVSIGTLRIKAGAERVVLYVTYSKGGREDIAVVREYQAQRQERDPGLVERVSELRRYLSERVDCVACYEQEADDAMAQAMWDARDDGYNLNVLWTKDKDLNMVGGLKMDPDTYELYAGTWAYGSTTYCKEKKKLVGEGTSFFWHQLLAGDSADNIPGLPTIEKDIRISYGELPAYYTNAYARPTKTALQRSQRAAAIQKAEAKLKPKACGNAGAVELLRKCRSDRQAYIVCRDAYVSHYGVGSITVEKWDGTTVTTTAGDLLLEQARLLWMRRTVGQDVLDWMKEALV